MEEETIFKREELLKLSSQILIALIGNVEGGLNYQQESLLPKIAVDIANNLLREIEDNKNIV